MLRKITQGSGNVVLERVLLPSSSQSLHNVSLKAFSTWLDAHHSPLSSNIPETSLSSSTNWPRDGRRFASTRHPPRHGSGKETERPELPRFLRRQQLQKTSTQETVKSVVRPASPSRPQNSPSSSKTPTFRSRHYDPDNQTTPKSELRPLEPHILSGRLKKLCNAGKIDDAVYMLKNAPLDAQNTQVWNTLIWECLKGKRFQLGYQLFIDMKRRGFSPTTRTFQTFFSGLSRIEHWPTHPKQLTNARSLYEAFQRHISSLKRHDPTNSDLTIEPLGGYIRILGNAGQYQEIFDVYYSMDQDGPLAPNQYIFTCMFQAIAAAKKDTTEGSVKVAADARMLWSQLTRAAKKAGFTPDSYTAVSALKALAGGNETDHELAFRIVEQNFGLVADRTTSKPGLFPLQPESLAAILKLCNETKQYSKCTQFYQQVKRRPEETGGVSILDRLHMEEVLRAEVALREPGLGYHAVETLEWMLRQEITGVNGPKIRPGLSTYNLVMQACWRSADWNSAARTFDLMTGYHSHDFKDGAVASNPRFDKRGPGRNLPVTAEFMSSMLKTALATNNRADMRQVLRITDYLGFDKLLRTGGTEKHETSKSAKHRQFFGNKFASAVVETVTAVLEDSGKHAKPEEARKWRALANEARTQLGVPTEAPARTPRRRTASASST
ncbi:hypothetical protein CVT25_011175 [Psilocybe cyanescens]|uniref:Pentacotripeptide-repeat region of PRORP domain-containing protein n=1 Tax=Psilocybe cyanescens TaxID=93625 RepID=A0A409WH33_PSICY|nr:hypothetical protein CVT25_011175 [Psilocybe cyanescens]